MKFKIVTILILLLTLFSFTFRNKNFSSEKKHSVVDQFNDVFSKLSLNMPCDTVFKNIELDNDIINVSFLNTKLLKYLGSGPKILVQKREGNKIYGFLSIDIVLSPGGSALKKFTPIIINRDNTRCRSIISLI